ncbi:hypothetical protein TNCV_1784791, partial [Trichonephila clavipes]
MRIVFIIELIEWCMKKGLIASTNECPKCDSEWNHTNKRAFFEIVPATLK